LDVRFEKNQRLSKVRGWLNFWNTPLENSIHPRLLALQTIMFGPDKTLDLAANAFWGWNTLSIRKAFAF